VCVNLSGPCVCVCVCCSLLVKQLDVIVFIIIIIVIIMIFYLFDPRAKLPNTENENVVASRIASTRGLKMK